MIESKAIEHFFDKEILNFYKDNWQKLTNLRLIGFYIIKDLISSSKDITLHALISNLLVELGKKKLFLESNDFIFEELKIVDFKKLEHKYKEKLKGKVVFFENKIYFQKYYLYLDKLKKILKNYRLQNNDFSIEKNEILSDFLSKNKNLNKQQQCALIVAFLKQFSIISGGPGTGKSFVITSLVNLFINLGIDDKDISLFAPTGKAVKRLEELINNEQETFKDLKVQTLHRALGYGSKNRVSKIQAKLVIVDECSMIDLKMMLDLLQLLSEECKIILVGDMNQLSPIELGNISMMIFSEQRESYYSLEQTNFIRNFVNDFSQNNRAKIFDDNITHLIENYRSEKNILEFADMIYKEKECMPDLKPYEGQNEGIFILEKNIIESLDKWFKEQYDASYFKTINSFKKMMPDDVTNSDSLNEIFCTINSRQVLSVTKSGLNGATYINQKFLREKSINNSQTFFSGMPIIVLKNNYDLHIFNGDIGVIIETKQGYFAYFLRGKSAFFLSVVNIVFEPSLVITVHKSQGSEYEKVILIADSNVSSELLTSSMLYTAITRAKKTMLLLGSKLTFEKNVS